MIVAPIATQLETLIQSVEELSERSTNKPTEENVASQRSRLSVQRSGVLTRATREPRSDWHQTTNLFDEKPTQRRYNSRSSVAQTAYRQTLHMDREDAFDDDSVDQMNQVMAAITDLPQ